MKFIHLSDLHLGKRVNDFSMLEEQDAILKEILELIDSESPDGVIIAGDVYDKTVPSAEAVQLFDGFLCALAERELQVFVISGNHDSPERIAFGSRIMDTRGIHLSPVYDGSIEPVVMRDGYGEVGVYMLPFIKPSHVRRYYEDRDVVNYTDAVRVAIEAMDIDRSRRNILVTHQFVVGSETCESEEISVGGTDQVNIGVFEGFDYVALGHIHGPQNCGSNRVRYCGTPLKYSFSEVKHEKSVTVVELGEMGGEPFIRTLPLRPIHDMSELRGSFAELTDPTFYTDMPSREDYLRITLTDENDVPDAAARLRMIYKNMMNLRYDNTRTRSDSEITAATDAETKSPYQLFAEFYELQNNAEMTAEQSTYIEKILEEIMEDTV